MIGFGGYKEVDVLDKVKQLVALMNENNLAEIEIQEKTTKIRVKKAGSEISHSLSTVPLVPGEAGRLEDSKVKLLDAKETENYVEVTAPMVGTFYRASSPGAEPYVSIGDKVDQDTAICIIEAMKIMNEVKSGVAGEIVEILAKEGEPVEFGQPLFSIKPVPS